MELNLTGLLVEDVEQNKRQSLHPIATTSVKAKATAINFTATTITAGTTTIAN